jgi:hypothetical protein
MRCQIPRENLVKNGAHQGAGIRNITDRRVALAFWAWEIAMLGVIAGDNDALVGAAVIDFGDASGVIAVYDAFRAGAIRNVEDEVGMRTGWK